MLISDFTEVRFQGCSANANVYDLSRLTVLIVQSGASELHTLQGAPRKDSRLRKISK